MTGWGDGKEGEAGDGKGIVPTEHTEKHGKKNSMGDGRREAGDGKGIVPTEHTEKHGKKNSMGDGRRETGKRTGGGCGRNSGRI